ncbi:LysR substrate-binding domain-containing protein [Streptomyces sp. M19]
MTTARPRGALLSATRCATRNTCWSPPALGRAAGRCGGGAGQGVAALEKVPVVEVHDSLPLVARYWSTVFDAVPVGPGTVIAPDLRAVLACVAAGAGLSVLPRYLCADALDSGEVVALLNPGAAAAYVLPGGARRSTRAAAHRAGA